MLSFDNFFRNLFAYVQISDDELNQYTMEHAQLLAPLPQYSSLQNDTLTAHNAYFGSISNEAIKANIQKSLTASMTAALNDFRTLAGQHEGAVRSTWGAGSPNYLRFYPLGVTEYHKATLENIDEKMTRYQQALTDLGSQLPPAVVNAFVQPAAPGVTEGVILRFRAARAAQLAAKGQTDASKSAAHASRDALEIQLMKNLLTVALDAVDKSDTEKANLRGLFPQHILRDTPSSSPPPSPPNGLSAPTGLQLQAGPMNSVIATWNAVTDATNYEVEKQLVGTDPDFSMIGSTGNTTHQFGGFSGGSTIRVRIRAFGTPGPGGTPQSPYSAVAEITFP